MDNIKIQKIGGACAIVEAFVYIFAFIVYGAVLDYPPADTAIGSQLSFLSEHHFILSIVNLVSYVLFGLLLAVLVLAIYERLKTYQSFWSVLASTFGIIWVGLVIASGMIANIGLNSVIEIGIKEPEKAMQIWSSIGIITEGLGGGNEVVGGIWVLLLSIIGLQGNKFSRALSIFGILVGVVGIITIIPLDIFTEIFGITQIIWFLWIGVTMLQER